MSAKPWARHLAVAAGYLGIALAFSWPLPLELGSALTGSPSGDTGVYVWNLWHFHHELVTHGSFPWFSREILTPAVPIPLTLHNYTTFTDLVALPFISVLGVTATFNLVYLAAPALTAYATFLLVRDVTRTSGEAWLAGLLFAFSPALVARGTGHFSLVLAAPLPLFVLAIRRLERQASVFRGGLAGAVLAWAYACDPYYAVYAVLFGAGYYACGHLRLHPRDRSARSAALRRGLDASIALLVVVSLVIAVSGGGRIEVWGMRLSATTVYTPMLGAMVLLAARVATSVRTEWLGPALPVKGAMLASIAMAAIACAGLMSPAIYTMMIHGGDTAWLWPDVLWRSSAPGVDALAFVLPNPQHALFGDWAARWLESRPNGLAENTASLTLVALATFAIAVLFYRFRRGRLWMALLIGFAWLSLGPFISVAGIDTHVPTPWAFLRYLPIVGGARVPTRFVVLVVLALAVLFALALRRITAAHRSARGWILAGVGALLAFEQAPIPRPLYDARVPRLYDTIAQDPRDVGVLEIPFGIRDGLSSYGDFAAVSQFFQTRHQKRLMGGYLSRVPGDTVRAIRRWPVLDALVRMSEGDTLAPAELAGARRLGPGFVERFRIGYVVVDLGRASPELVTFVEAALRLVVVSQEGRRRLYRTPCCRHGGIGEARLPGNKPAT